MANVCMLHAHRRLMHDTFFYLKEWSSIEVFPFASGGSMCFRTEKLLRREALEG